MFGAHLRRLLDADTFLSALVVVNVVVLTGQLAWGIPWWVGLPPLLLLIVVGRRTYSRRFRARKAERGEEWASDFATRRRRRTAIAFMTVVVLLGVGYFMPDVAYWVLLGAAIAVIAGWILIESKERRDL